MKYSEAVSKQNAVLQCICLIFAHFTCIVLQQRKFFCYYSKFQDENLYAIYSWIVAEENIDQG
jgi:hypothetical protein